MSGGAKQLADGLITMVEKIIETYPDKFALAKTPRDVQGNFEKGLTSLPMGMENGAPVEGDLSNVNHFQESRIRYIKLTHGKGDQICDLPYDTKYTWNELSPFEREVVQKMDRVGVMVDIPHVSDSTFYQVMELTSAPCIASHSSARCFTPEFGRDMSDDMIKTLAENDAVIQINFGSSFLTKDSQDKLRAAREHIVNWHADNELDRQTPKAKEYIAQYMLETDPYSTVGHCR